MINIQIAMAGGNGEILASKIICNSAIATGLDVKSYNSQGLVQRIGKIYANIRIGRQVLSPEIPNGCVDIMLGMEPLEAYRKSINMKEAGTIILSNYRIYPALAIYEEAEYPNDIIDKLKEKYNIISVDFFKVTNFLSKLKLQGNYRIRIKDEFIPLKIMILYSYCIGILAKILSDNISYENWIDSIIKEIPREILAENIQAFDNGYKYYSGKLKLGL